MGHRRFWAIIMPLPPTVPAELSTHHSVGPESGASVVQHRAEPTHQFALLVLQPTGQQFRRRQPQSRGHDIKRARHQRQVFLSLPDNVLVPVGDGLRLIPAGRRNLRVADAIGTVVMGVAALLDHIEIHANLEKPDVVITRNSMAWVCSAIQRTVASRSPSGGTASVNQRL